MFIFALFPNSVYAVLRSNLVDPGMRLRNWGFLHTSPSLYFDPTCKESPSNDPIWRISGLGLSSTPCDPNGPMYAQWSTVGGAQVVTFNVDNQKNDPSLQCHPDRSYIGIQLHYFPGFGYKNVLKMNQLDKFVVRATVRNDETTVCQTGNCQPYCSTADGRNPDGNGWSSLIIGIPFYDGTYQQSYYLELVPYGEGRWWNTNQNGQTFFHAEQWNNMELWRIFMNYPANTQDQTMLPPGTQHTYNIDILPIIKNLSWRAQIDWNAVQISDVYVGVEISGDAKTNFTASDIDVLYELKPTDIYQPAGWFDGANPDVPYTVRGWTCDQDKFSEPLEIELYEGATKLSTPLPVIADSGFEAPALCGNTGNHRFYYTFPAGHPIRNNGTHAITAKAIGVGVAADGSAVQTSPVVLPLSANSSNIITCPIIPTPTPIPGDVTGDRKVNVTDLRIALAQSPPSIFTYNLVVGNYGR